MRLVSRARADGSSPPFVGRRRRLLVLGLGSSVGVWGVASSVLVIVRDGIGRVGDMIVGGGCECGLGRGE